MNGFDAQLVDDYYQAMKQNHSTDLLKSSVEIEALYRT